MIGILETIQMYANKWWDKNVMENWKYSYDCNHSFRNESNFGIKLLGVYILLNKPNQIISLHQIDLF